MSQKHAPDEFDLVVGSAGRRGAHRPPPGRATGLLPVLLVVVVVTAVVLGVVTLLGTPPPESAMTGVGATPAGTATPTGGATGTPSRTAPASGSPTGDPSPTSPSDDGSSDDGSSEVDRSAAVTVLNGTRTRGLAGRAAAVLSTAGWEIARTDNHRAGSPPTTVFYGSERLRATAEAVADDLGGAQVQLDGALAEQITVVLGTDFPGA